MAISIHSLGYIAAEEHAKGRAQRNSFLVEFH